MKLFIASAASNDIPEKYFIDCKNFLTEIFKYNHELMYGANNKGLMGLSYKIAKDFDRNIVGVCPEGYREELELIECNSEFTVKNISERNDMLTELCDAIVFLPGGIGTLYELFAALEGKRAKDFDKPIIIYNSCDYFDSIISLLEKMYTEKFTSINVRDYYHVSNNIEDAINYINSLKN